MSDPSLLGQDVSIRVVQDGVVIATIDAPTSFNETVSREIKESGHLGEFVNRFVEILNGYGGDMELKISKSDWNLLGQQIDNKATRKTPNLEFNVVRADLFANGESSIYTYKDVSWGDEGTTLGSRGDFVKVKLMFKCSSRAVDNNRIL